MRPITIIVISPLLCEVNRLVAGAWASLVQRHRAATSEHVVKIGLSDRLDCLHGAIVAGAFDNHGLRHVTGHFVLHRSLGRRACHCLVLIQSLISGIVDVTRAYTNGATSNNSVTNVTQR